MTALYIAIGVVAGLVLLIVMAFLFGRAKVRIVCRDKLTVRASILGIRFTLYPDKKEKPEDKNSLKKCRNPHRALQRELARQEKAARKKLKALEKARKKKKKKQKLQPKRGQPNPNLRENMSMIAALLRKLYHYTHGKLKIKVKRMHVAVGAEDAAEAAIRYGVIVQAAAYILQFIESKFTHIQRKPGAMDIRPDYLSTEMTADIDIVASIRLHRFLSILMGMYSAYKKERRRALKKAKERMTEEIFVK